jgi:hypothetical protein
MNLLHNASTATVAWNLPLAAALTISGSVDWQGLVLAPNAAVREETNGQFHGQLIADSIPAFNRDSTRAAFTGCLPPATPPEPPAPPDETLTLTALCVNANGDLTMRLTNSGDQRREGHWEDLGGPDSGAFDVPAGHVEFFDVQNPTEHSVIRATSGDTTITADGDTRPCEGQITVRLVTVGPAPPGATWTVGLNDGANVSKALTLESGQEDTVTITFEESGGSGGGGGVTPEPPPVEPELMPRPVVHARVSAPPIGRVGTALSYRVSVTGGGKSGATSVRLCTRPPSSPIEVHAAGTFAYRGLRCRSVGRLGSGRSMGFTVSALASARGHLFPFARATAVGIARPSRAVTRVLVLGPAVACPARARGVKAPGSASRKAPLAHAAC